MKKFEIGKSYKSRHADAVITIADRTERFVRYTLDGKSVRSEISVNPEYGEYIFTPATYTYFALDEATDAATNVPQEPKTPGDNKAAAMTAQEATARKMIAEQTTEYLLNQWEATTTNRDPFIPTVRGWLMDELQSRYPEAYDKWLDSEVCEDAALREYINAAIQAEQAATDNEPQEAADSAAGQPAPVKSLNALISAAMYGWRKSLNAYCVAAGYYEDAQGEAAYQEAREAFAELQRMGYTDAQISALYAMRPQDRHPEPTSDGAEPETVELHDTIDAYRVCEENGIAWARVNADTLAIRAEDYQKLLDGAKNKRYIQNLRRDAGRFCGGSFSLAGTLTG